MAGIIVINRFAVDVKNNLAREVLVRVAAVLRPWHDQRIGPRSDLGQLQTDSEIGRGKLSSSDRTRPRSGESAEDLRHPGER